MSSAKYTLPPIKQPAGISVSKINNNWKLVGSTSPLIKQETINYAARCRKANVVLNLRRKLKNPYSYINSSTDEIDIEHMGDKCRKLTLKFKGDLY